jgi:DNA-directed RNA polymerase specialized sigma24 family protein
VRHASVQALAFHWQIEIFNGFLDDATFRESSEKADFLLAELDDANRRAFASVMASLGHDDDADPPPRRTPTDILDIFDGAVELVLEKARAAFLVEVAKGLFRPPPGTPGRGIAEWNELRMLAYRIAYRRLRDEVLADAFAYRAIVQMALREDESGPADNPTAFVARVTRNLMTDWFRRRARLRLAQPRLLHEPMLVGEPASDRRGSPPGLAAIGAIAAVERPLRQLVLVGDLLISVPQRVLGTWLGKTANHIKQIKHHALDALREHFPGDEQRTLGDTVALLDPIVVELARRALAGTESSGPNPNGSIMNNDQGGADEARPEQSTLRVVLEQLPPGTELSDWWFATAAAGDQPTDVHAMLSQRYPDRMRQHEERRRVVARRFQAELAGAPLRLTMARNAFELLGFGAIARWLTEPRPHADRQLDPVSRLANGQESGIDRGVVLRLNDNAMPGHFDVTLEHLPDDCGDVRLQSMNPGDDTVFHFEERRITRSLPLGHYLLFYRQAGGERIWPFHVEGPTSESPR